MPIHSELSEAERATCEGNWASPDQHRKRAWLLAWHYGAAQAKEVVLRDPKPNNMSQGYFEKIVAATILGIEQAIERKVKGLPMSDLETP